MADRVARILANAATGRLACDSHPELVSRNIVDLTGLNKVNLSREAFAVRRRADFAPSALPKR
jgi:hypothetical protein